MALAHISHIGVIPGPPALFAGGSGIGSPRKHTYSGLPRHGPGAAPGMTTRKVPFGGRG